MLIEKMELEDLVNSVDYKNMYSNSNPSKFALTFVNFIKLVNGGQGEDNKTPIVHYDMLDQLEYHTHNLFVAARGLAKTSTLEYLILFIAIYGGLPIKGYENLSVGMFIADTMDNGVSSLKMQLQSRYDNSEFLQKYLPKVKILEGRFEFVNLNGHKLFIKAFGVTSGVRGFKAYGKRPQFACHAKGTIITTELGTHKVEDYKGVVFPSSIDYGYSIELFGLLDNEIVNKDHKYACKTLYRTRHKKYINNTTESTTDIKYSDIDWVEANKLCFKTLVGNQTFVTHYIAKPIDYTVGGIEKIKFIASTILGRDKFGRIKKTGKEVVNRVHNSMLHDSFWWLYGLWLADGSANKTGKISFYMASAEDKRHIIDTLLAKAKECGINIYDNVIRRAGCVEMSCCDRALARWLKNQHKGNSIKDMPEWVLKLDLNKQKEILLGYISGDGFVDYKNNQIRINSVNITVLKQLGIIAERLGLPYHIRNTKKVGKTTFPAGYTSDTKHQYEIRFRDNVKNILGYDIKDSSFDTKECFIENGYIFRKVKKVTKTNTKYEFIPINTPSHTYTTEFGLSHNCLDDLMSDKNANSPTIINDIEQIIYGAVEQALYSPTKKLVIWTGTPFNKKDPLYKAAGSDAWNTRVYPICESFPCSRKEFVGAWEDRFPYEKVKKEFDRLLSIGMVEVFNKELMLRIISDEDRLVSKEDIVWFKRDNVLKNKDRYNFYITTDFAVSDKHSADYSVILVWAYTSNGDWLLVDGVCNKQLMDRNIDDLFSLVAQYKPFEVGVEITGQQKGFISWMYNEMVIRNCYFTFASDKKSKEAGIRPSTDKLTRFSTVVPLFKSKKIWFPEELKGTTLIIEALDEILHVTTSGMKARHDDINDCISQLPLLKAWKPSEEMVGKQNYSGVYESDIDDVIDITPLNSYIV
jgi:predicted phage terminase large subunit-like protein